MRSLRPVALAASAEKAVRGFANFAKARVLVRSIHRLRMQLLVDRLAPRGLPGPIRPTDGGDERATTSCAPARKVTRSMWVEG